MLKQLNPYVRRAWYDYMDAVNSIPDRVIFDYEIMYIKDGAATITIEGVVYEGKPGDIFFFKPGQRHSIIVHGQGPLCQPHIHFDLLYYEDREEVPIPLVPPEQMTEQDKRYFRPDVTPELLSPFPSYIHVSNPRLIEQLIFDVIYIFNNSQVFRELNLQWSFLRMFSQLLAEIYWTKNEKATRKEDYAAQIKLFLEHNLERRVTLDEMADMYYLNKTYLGRIFRQTYNISPIQYHQLLRIQKAKELIQYTNLSIREISQRMGFEKVQDFSRTFKRVEGITPSEFRHHTL